MKTNSYNFSLFAVSFILLWMPLQRYFLHVDGAGRFPLFLLMAIFALNIVGIRKMVWKRPITIYFILAIYMFITGLIKGSHLVYDSIGSEGAYLMFYHIFMAPLLMTVVALLSIRKYDKTLKIISFSLIVYCALCLWKENITESGRLGERINANEIALNAAIAYMCVLLRYVGRRISISKLFFYEMIPFITIVATGSRMAFGMIAIVSFLTFFQLRRKGDFRSLLIVFSMFALSIYIFSYVVENTLLGNRLMDTTSQIEGQAFETGTILDYFGDRGVQYYYSWPLFLQKPIIGIGFHQWILYSPTGHVFHSEYLVQLCENGLIGFILYLVFFISLILKLRRMWRIPEMINQRSIRILFFIMLSIAFANSVLWTYNSYGVFIIYSLVYTCSYNYKKTSMNDIKYK